ncbi:Nuclear fragile X mental retardation-interacting protein 1 [Macleaya cordata]|uniref:Nuclear fragile X mental retardation-interacting protein 1 n=1 Tax=Macleaya cordata TaxID=56857 RepID=A0A200QTL3_MACCD|nr:Nuclear fragile X mental retardation-interacting protein 1 [Macleaya cordata]
MFPFQPSFSHLPNQIQIEGSNCSAPQQVMSSNQCLTNLSNTGSNINHQFPCSSCAHHNPSNFSQLHGLNPRVPVPFNGSNTHLSNLNGNFAPMPNTHFLNVANHQLQLQNSHVGRPFLGSVPNDLAQPSAQFFSLNTLHNLNSVMTSPQCGHLHNFPQNLNQLPPIQQHGQLFVHNQNRPLQPHVHANMPGGKFNPHNQPQHMNQATGFPQSQFLQNPVNPSQVLPYSVHPCSNPSLGCSNQGVQTLGSQNSNFPMNQQLGLMNSSEAAPQNTQDQHVYIPTTKVQNSSLPSLTNGPLQMQQTQKGLQPVSLQWSQGNNAKDGGNNISNISQRNHQNNFTRNHHESGKRDSANPRFQKSKFQPRENANLNFRSFNGKGGKGHHNAGARKSHMANSTNQTTMGCKRSLPLNYTEQEIQQWREERRKNFPLKSNVEKKSADQQTHSEDIDEEAKKRRQQLKEILAKQAELGVEVAELPPNYLTDSENQVCEKAEEPSMQNKKGRFQNKYGKRGRRGNSNRFAKKQKFGKEGSFTEPEMNKRKPTLLQKLLGADIKRDKSHLLQVFRFMVMNSFLKEWPEKPLEFPLVTVKDGDCRSGIIKEKSTRLQGSGNDAANDEEEDDDDDNDAEFEDIGETDSIRESIEKSEGEEGEITD